LATPKPPAPPAPPGRTAPERLPAHPDGVDLVDEDDARAAPLAGEPLRLARDEAHNDRVDADERRGEAGAGDGDEGRVEAGGDRLREHRLARAGGTDEEQAALPLAPRALERVAGLPQADDPPHLFLRLRLPTNVRELDAPFGVAGLEAAHLREIHREQRPEEDDEVEDQEDRQHHEQRQRGDDGRDPDRPDEQRAEDTDDR